MMSQKEVRIAEIVELLKTAEERNIEIAYAFINSLLQK